MKTIRLAPSLLAADFLNLADEIRRAEEGGADLLHCDVMDGVYVPNISFGFPVISQIAKITDLPLDVHLMIDRPLRYVERFCDAGADILTIHAEADTEEHNQEALRRIREKGVRAGVSIKPGTDVPALDPYMDLMDLILVMTVEPGFGGQKFMADMMPKVRALRKIIDVRTPGVELEVDGGVNLETAKVCVEAGANVLVAGSALFKAPNTGEFIQQLHSLF